MVIFCTFKRALALGLVPALLVSLAGCAGDAAVSSATRKASYDLMLISEGVRRDSDESLYETKKEGLARLATIEELTIVDLRDNNQYSRANEELVRDVFKEKRREFLEQLEQSRRGHDRRVEALRLLARALLEIDEYYQLRNNQAWKAVGTGAAQGVLSNLFQAEALLKGDNVGEIADD